MARRVASVLLVVTLILFLAGDVLSRLIVLSDSSSPILVSDGVGTTQSRSATFLLKPLFSSKSCDETYGFLPCTSTILGNVFLILVYGYMMFVSAKLLSDGSEILLQVLGPGIIGGLFLPILSSLPDAAIILASGISGSKEDAQDQLSVGMGLLAGSNVLLLTVLWGTCLMVGKCDIENSIAVDEKDTKSFSLTGSGVSTDIWTSYAARIMVISVIPFIIAQLPEVLSSGSQSRAAILASFIVSMCLLISYSVYQVSQPWIQRRKFAYAVHKRVMSGILGQLKLRTIGRLLTDEGKPNTEVMEKLFEKLDKDSDGFLSPEEMRGLLVGIQFEEMDMNFDDAVSKVMKDFDISEDSHINKEEFVRGISKWLHKAMRSKGHFHCDESSKITRLLNSFQRRAQQECDLLVDQEDSVVSSDKEKIKWNVMKAVLMLLGGTVIAGVFADPLVDSVDNLSTATGIPSFFVSFVILPFASSSEVVSTLIFTSRKKLRTTSLAYSEIYGSVTMSNTLSLSVFLGLVYIRELDWNFFSEVLIIFIVCAVMGIIASFRTTFPLWIALLACALYPLSLAMVFVLDYVLGLS
ncbi:sodium/calcium exchanger NCL-like [Punica granatum]|uniref:Sodium/calcium exchanger NCL-like n=1 Tax=Punica granatum TaxID=22663 RepID=A0A218WM99_PUNGR|nr:sodium/calcium exchanger NCL-like [Punica granatum]OWM73371.1 hypothetical protein CDL15_Pgr001485 [Punica granatum]